MVTDVSESMLGQQMARRCIVGMMSGEQPFYSESVKGIVGDCVGCLFSKSFAPESRPQMDSNLENLFLRLVWPQPCASHMLMVFAQKYRPVLDSVFSH